MNRWFLRRSGHEVGPLPFNRLIELARQRDLSADDTIRFGIDGEWRQVASIGRLIVELPFPSHSGRPLPLMVLTTTRSRTTSPSEASRRVTVKGRRTSATSASGRSAAGTTSTSTKQPSPLVPTQIWWCRIAGIEYGPVDLLTLERWVAQRRLLARDEVKLQADGTYVKAGVFPRLFPRSTAAVQSDHTKVAIVKKPDDPLAKTVLTPRPADASLRQMARPSDDQMSTTAPLRLEDTRIFPISNAATAATVHTMKSRGLPSSPQNSATTQRLFEFIHFLHAAKLAYLGFGLAGLMMIGTAAIAMQGSSTSNQRAALYPARGTITLDDQPIPGATIRLAPVDPQQNVNGSHTRAIVDAEGHFELGTFRPHDGAPAGEFIVTVVWAESTMVNGQSVAGPNRAPVRYETSDQSPLKITIAKSSNELAVIRLTSDGQPAGAQDR